MKTALASYPRSGNTYLRYLLFHCLGMKSGWVYGAERPAPHRTEEGMYDPESELLKTHNLDHSPFDRVIHLVRSPFDALEAYYYYSTDICETPRDWGGIHRIGKHCLVGAYGILAGHYRKTQATPDLRRSSGLSRRTDAPGIRIPGNPPPRRGKDS